jgi:hypothetical protein
MPVLGEAGPPLLGIAAQVEFESNFDAKLKAVDHIWVSSAYLQALSTWV